MADVHVRVYPNSANIVQIQRLTLTLTVKWTLHNHARSDHGLATTHYVLSRDPESVLLAMYEIVNLGSQLTAANTRNFNPGC